MRSTNTSDILVNELAIESIDELDSIESELAGDRRAILLVVMLSFFFGLTIGIVSTSVLADESVPIATQVPIGETEKQETKAKWKPPVAKKVTLPSPVDEEQAKAIAEKWGVRLNSLSFTAAGYMIDFRFHVIDEKKASIFFDHRVKPYLLVEASDVKLPVPMATKVGALRTTNRGKNIKPNKNYYIMFGNPDRHVKPGDKVTLVIGDFKAENLDVLSHN